MQHKTYRLKCAFFNYSLGLIILFLCVSTKEGKGEETQQRQTHKRIKKKNSRKDSSYENMNEIKLNKNFPVRQTVKVHNVWIAFMAFTKKIWMHVLFECDAYDDE